MNRIGVFVFYDKDGCVDASEEYLVCSLASFLDRLIVVVNGEIEETSLQIIRRYTDEIVIRPNTGFDGKAYQDIILHYLSREELKGYDELVLLNDTFFGPFYPWEELFHQMENNETDFWGLTRQLPFFSYYLEMMVPEHIQSYFLVFSQKILANDLFYHYWESLKVIIEHKDAIKNFELTLTPFFSDHNFSYSVYTDQFRDLDYLNSTDNAHILYCYSLLKDCHFPILKKKSFSVENLQSFLAVDYIMEHYKDYPIRYIWDNLYRTSANAQMIKKLKDFCSKHSAIYIYGHGQIGRCVESYCNYSNIMIKGFIETKPHKNNNAQIIAWKDFVFEKDVGIIVALGRKNTLEVMEFLPTNEDILFIKEIV